MIIVEGLICDQEWSMNNFMQLEVSIEYCINCRMHGWCSQHDEYKYLFYFQKIKETVTERLKLGENIIVTPREPPTHYQKFSCNTKDNKYFDLRRDEDVYFPRLGSF